MARVIDWLLRIAIGLLFLWAGAIKVWDTQAFTLAVQNYQLVDWTGSILIAVYLPFVEIVCALALLSGRLYRGALAALIVLSLIFLGAISSAWWRDLDVACGCFGSSSNQTNYPLHLGGGILLLGALLILSWLEWRRSQSPADEIRALRPAA